MLNPIDTMNMKACFMQAFFYCALCLLGACHSLESRITTTQDLLNQHGATSTIINTPSFPLFSVATGGHDSAQSLTIFIEGDGYAWIDRYSVSDDPTPIDPIGLKMALHHQGSKGLYLARPCQYVSAPACNPSYWSYNRFAPAVIDSYMGALDQIADQYSSQSFHIVGYSGGAYIALMLASQRTDITKVTTVAGLLDPNAWTEHHGISPLQITVGTDDLIQQTANTHFTHLCGQDDEITPYSLTQDFVQKATLQGLNNHHIIEKDKASHDTLWLALEGL